MSKNVYYRYNPETDNFERVYPSLKKRLAAFGKMWIGAILLTTLLFVCVFYLFDSPTEENLRARMHSCVPSTAYSASVLTTRSR